MADKLTSMAVFVRAVECGSFSEAGEDLEMSPQMAGRHVRSLERQLGVRLIDRTTRSQHATEAGEIYYARCKAILAEAEAADAAIQMLSAEPRGLLRLTAPATLGTSSIVPLIARFMQSYPEVEVDLTLGDRTVDLVNAGYDAAIRAGDLQDSSLFARRLADYEFAVCAAPEYLAQHGTPKHPNELAGHHCLGFTYPGIGSQSAHSDWRFWSKGEEYRVPINPRFIVNDARAMHAAAIAGMGIIMGPLPNLRANLDSGGLTRLLSEFSVPSLPLHIVYTTRRPLPKLARFIEAAAQAFPYRPAD